jgi:hypothetical protein
METTSTKFNPEQFCDHCTYTIDNAECSCGCTGYDEWCGCNECLINHFGLDPKDVEHQ